ncbi:hypothetical protein [uncultured Aquimarina sp.]|uniref:hypothetical protein n=1 Tax=uncultured Aquimarina sp. TaxID=575652 RepID=UPI002622E6CD|nr:hypothetical protein [uncultured Aquimarina sp.]
MKYIVSLIILCWYSGCIAQEVSYKNEEPTKNDLAIIDATIGRDKNLITFTEKFDNDQIEVFVDQRSIYNGSISTEPSTGSARGVEIDRNSDSILILINNEKIQLKNSTDYQFIYITKQNEKYIAEYQKKPILFY